VNSLALHDALNSASTAVLMAENGCTREAEAETMHASAAASLAFEPGTALADALSLILGAVAGLPDGAP
jgi:hypothetical protein